MTSAASDPRPHTPGPPPTGSAWRKVGAITVSGLRRTLRDRANIFFIFFFPLLLVMVLGSVFGGEFRPQVGVTAPDGDALAAAAVTAIEAEDLDVSHYSNADSLRDAVELGEVSAGVVLADDYAAQLRSGSPVEVQVIAGPGSSGPQLLPIVQGALAPENARLHAAQFGSEHGSDDFDAALARADDLSAVVVDATVRTTTVGDEVFPSSMGQFDMGASGQLVLFMFINGLTASVLLVQSRQLGVITRMLSTPTSPRVVLAGEMIRGYAITLLQGLYIMGATWLLFSVNWGSFPAALVLVAAFALVPAAASMLIGALFRNADQAAGVSVLLGLALAALGGSMAPLEIFSPTIRTVANITPHAWANDAFAEVVRHGGNVGDILPQLGVLAGMAAVLTLLAAVSLRRTLS